MKLKARGRGSHKGMNGRVLVVGGSRCYSGAPALVSLAALRTGVDLVYTVVPSCISRTAAGYSPDLIVWGFEGEYLNENALGLVEELLDKTDALVIGNGLTKEKGAMKTAQHILDSWKKPVVIDADCIGNVKARGKNVVYTPHAGEFERLTGKKPVSEQVVHEAAGKLGVTILLKGRVDVISDGKMIKYNRTGNAGMTVGGTGDVLAGIVGGFLSQGYPAFEAARMGAYVNGTAGDLAFKKFGYCLLASDLLIEIPDAIKSLSRNR